MKTCVECKHYLYDAYPENMLRNCLDPSLFHRCTRDTKIHIVTGKQYGKTKVCMAEREDALRLEEFRCGKEGKFWEAK
jgi:hypothetical protein